LEKENTMENAHAKKVCITKNLHAKENACVDEHEAKK
jgi:hypothetical protein